MARLSVVGREQVLKHDFEVQEIFTEKERELITFARKANRDPNKITDEKFEELRKRGASDSEIVEALGVMELFTAFNKFLDSLHVEIDF